ASSTGTPELTSCRSLYRTFVWLTLGESLMICLNASSIVMCVLRLGIRKPPPADSMVKANGGYVCVAVLMGGALNVAYCVACCCVCGHAEDAEGLVEVELFVHRFHAAGESDAQLPGLRVRNLDTVSQA